MERIGVIGLGRMGRAMATRMAESAQVAGWTRSGVTAEDAAAMGISGCESLAELVAQADVLVLSLFDDASVAEVLANLCELDLTGRLVIDTSTVSPKLMPSMADKLAERGAIAADAPIAGGPEMVMAGTCGVFIGGDDSTVERAKPVIDLISNRVFHVGPLGSGMGMKTTNNMLLAGIFAAISESVQVAKQAGIPFETAIRILAGGPAGAPFFRDRVGRILGEDTSVGFPISGTLKDASVFLAAAEDLGVETPVLARAKVLMEAAAGEGLIDRDAAALVSAAWNRV